MPENTVFVEKKGSLVLAGGIEVRIVEDEESGLRLFFDRPYSMCEDAIVFEEDELEEGKERASAPMRRMGPAPVKRAALIKKRRDERYGMEMFD